MFTSLKRFDEPILKGSSKSIFHCPIQNKDISWESVNIFNPGTVVKDDKVYMFYRGEEDEYGNGTGNHNSRIGLAISKDGLQFEKYGKPILFPDHDDQELYEYPGGCEDPRVIETDDGNYVMTYTQWNHQIAVLAVATSKDLIHWKKHGYAFKGGFKHWSKSGSIVCKCGKGRIIAAKIHGKYWMYWGEGTIYLATSDDLVSWDIFQDEDNYPIPILERRSGKFDSRLVEPGPPAIITKDGILLLYNGKNSAVTGDKKLGKGTYSAGYALFDTEHPMKLLNRCEEYFLTPEKPHELKGQYQTGTTFVQGLTYFKGKWLLYYGAADTTICVSILDGLKTI